MACFRLFTTGVEGNESEIAEWFVSLRSGSSGESATKVRNVLNISKTNNIDAKIKIIGVTGNLTVELWVRPIKYTSLYVQLLNNGTDLLPLYKDWTFYNVSGSTGTEPTTDSQNNVYAYPSTKNVVQYNIAPAVENNLVAMDANGLVKDSGIGSGSLSMALTKLNGIEAGAEANVQSDWDEGDASSDAFIKNKPLYNLYYSSASYKVIASVANTTTTSGVSWSLMYTTRFHNASAFGVIQGHGNIRCSYIKTAGTATSTINFYTAPDPNTEGRTLIIAYLPGYTRFQATYFVRKSEIDFSVFGNNPPEGTTYTDSNLVKAETIVQSEGSSGTAPVKVDESGELIPVPMDSTPTASRTSLMTSGDIKTALDMKAGADNSIAIYDAYVGNTTQAWYKLAERSYTASNTTLNIAFLATICNNASTGPLSFFIHAAVQIPSEAGSSITIRNISSSPISNAFDINRIKNTKIRLVVTGTSGNATVALYLYQGGSSMSMSLSEVCASGVSKPAKKGNWTYTSYPGSSSPGETTEPTGTSYQDMAWVFAKELQTAVTDPTASGTALSFISSLTQDKNGVMTATKKSVLVDSTYSAAGTNPVNGTAVAAALATSLTDVAYVANQSGGGGNLNKTINGTTTSVLAFMNDSEAVAIWADAKTAAANAS